MKQLFGGFPVVDLLLMPELPPEHQSFLLELRGGTIEDEDWFDSIV